MPMTTSSSTATSSTPAPYLAAVRPRRWGRARWVPVAGAAMLALALAGCDADSPAISASGTTAGAGTSVTAVNGGSSTSAGTPSSAGVGSGSTSSTGGTTRTNGGGAPTTQTTGGGTGAQPAQSGEVFDPGTFSNLPLPPGSQPVNAPQETPNGTLRSWKITGQTPQQVLDFYNQQLPTAGWTVANGPGPSGATDWAGEWGRANEVLRVTASPFNGDRYVTQLDLQLTHG